jgi:predicted RNA-binding protein with PUA-like domain
VRARLSRPVAHWLLKEEPDHYSWSNLVRDGRTEWDGVQNALALRHLRQMAPGDRALYYHTGLERACVGIVEVASSPHPDRSGPRGSWSVAVRAVRPLRRPIPLSEVKADPALAGFDLVRMPRLSVVPMSDDQWDRLLAHEDTGAWPPVRVTPGSGGGRGTSRRRPPTAGRRTR